MYGAKSKEIRMSELRTFCADFLMVSNLSDTLSKVLDLSQSRKVRCYFVLLMSHTKFLSQYILCNNFQYYIRNLSKIIMHKID